MSEIRRKYTYLELDEYAGVHTVESFLATAVFALYAPFAEGMAFIPKVLGFNDTYYDMKLRVAWGALGILTVALTGCGTVITRDSKRLYLSKRKIRSYMRAGASERLLVHVGELTPYRLSVPARPLSPAYKIDLTL